MAAFDLTQDLDANQQDLLQAALDSNKPRSGPRDMSRQSPFVPPGFGHETSFEGIELDPAVFPDFLDGTTGFDFDQTELSVDPDELDIHPHDKRKASDTDADDDDEGENDSKRREGDDKQAKKPGRKPLTSEPTTKRKAQNRAAQRAFRDRKEKHLKDLETKVVELTKTSEEEKQENGILRAQVSRLQAELRDYRKRLASDAGKNRSPSTAAPAARDTIAFAFDFPVFGQVPPHRFFASESKVKQEATDASADLRRVPHHNSNGQQASTAQSTSTTSSSMQNFADLFSPSLLDAAANDVKSPEYGFPRSTQSPVALADNGTSTNSGIERVFQFNSESGPSTNDSPSQSSMSQFNTTSSSCTSPAASHSSPKRNTEPKDPVDTTSSHLTTNELSKTNSLSTSSTLNGIDWLASQNGGQFDPVLFGDYRESQEAIVGDGEFSNGFFNDAYPVDFGSPFDLKSPPPALAAGPTPQSVKAASPQKPAACAQLLAEVANAQAGGDDTSKPAAIIQSDGSMLSANTIWNQLQKTKSFQDGTFDLDGLCSELRSKAKCSESGLAVPAEQVAAVFRKMEPGKGSNRSQLLFDTSLVDEAFTKLGSGNINWGGFGLSEDQLY